MDELFYFQRRDLKSLLLQQWHNAAVDQSRKMISRERNSATKTPCFADGVAVVEREEVSNSSWNRNRRLWYYYCCRSCSWQLQEPENFYSSWLISCKCHHHCFLEGSFYYSCPKYGSMPSNSYASSCMHSLALLCLSLMGKTLHQPGSWMTWTCHCKSSRCLSCTSTTISLIPTIIKKQQIDENPNVNTHAQIKFEMP